MFLVFSCAQHKFPSKFRNMFMFRCNILRLGFHSVSARVSNMLAHALRACSLHAWAQRDDAYRDACTHVQTRQMCRDPGDATNL